MPLLTPTSVPASIALTAETIFQCQAGQVGISTEGGGANGYHWLQAGDRVQLGAGLTVHYVNDGDARADALHYMPATVSA